MVFTGSGFSAVFSSSCMPFLKALMPCATSPIRSEILPRPNNSRTTAITTIQCQMLREPILQPSKNAAGDPAQPLPETRLGRCQKQGLKPRQIAVNALPLTDAGVLSQVKAVSAAAVAFGLHGRRQRQFQ